MSRPWFLSLNALTLSSLLLTGAPAHADDPFDQTVRVKKVQEQKLDFALRDQLADALRLKGSDPGQAETILKRAQATLDNDELLTEARRRDFQSIIKQRMRDLAAAQRTQEQAARATAENDIRSKYEAQLKKSGGGGSTPAYSNVRNFINSGNEQLALQEKLRQDRDRGVLNVLRDLDKSFVPPMTDGYVSFPSYWRQLSNMPTRSADPQMTKEEAALLKTLNSTMSVDFDRKPLKEALDYLQERTNSTILLDKNTLQEAMIEYDAPVSFKAKKLTVRTILKKVLAEQGLTYVIRDGMIEVMTPQKAAQTLVVRTYDIADLLPQQNNQMMPFGGGGQQSAMYAMQLMSLIANTIEPSSWAVNGGNGTMGFMAPSRLIIRSTAEMHYTLKNSMLR